MRGVADSKLINLSTRIVLVANQGRMQDGDIVLKFSESTVFLFPGLLSGLLDFLILHKYPMPCPSIPRTAIHANVLQLLG